MGQKTSNYFPPETGYIYMTQSVSLTLTLRLSLSLRTERQPLTAQPRPCLPLGDEPIDPILQ